MKIIGAALVTLGLVALVYAGIGYARRTTVLDLGRIRVTAAEHKALPIAPVAAGIALIGGLALFVAPRMRRA